MVVLSFFVKASGCFCVFCRQKTAYEMRISDWSSDVCSSDLLVFFAVGTSRAPAVGSMPRAPHRRVRQMRSRRSRVVLPTHWPNVDRKSVVSGKRVSVRVDLGGRRIIRKKIQAMHHNT